MPSITAEQLADERAKAEQRVRVLEQQLSQVSGALLAARGAVQALTDLAAVAESAALTAEP